MWGRAMALAALCIALGASIPAAHAAAPLPPDLVALEQQMAQLQANSERFSLQLELAFELGGSGGPLGSGKSPGSAPQSIPLVLLIAGVGEASDSPSQASVTASLLGLSTQQTRTIGNTVYRLQPEAARIDGGRPWVSGPLKPKSSSEAQGLDPGGILESDQGGKLGTFSKLIETLNTAQSIVESGPVTVDDQRVTEFDATLDPTPFLEKLKPKSKEPQHPLKNIFEGPETGNEPSPAKPAPPPSFKLELFIAPNGLPVRARFTFSAENTSIAVRVDTLAINIPVHVTAPPPRQTISEAQLIRIEQRRARRALKEALRHCRSLHGKRAALCRRIARLNTHKPSSSGSLF